MRILPDLPDLQIIPTSALCPHEHAEDGRSGPIAEAVQKDGVLRNPPIVLQLAGEPERYVVLDGANRTTAFGVLGIEDILAQVVHPGDTRVEVETWNHAILDLPEPELTQVLAAIPEVGLVPSDPEQAAVDLQLGSGLAYLSLRGGRVVCLVADVPDMARRVDGLHRIVGACKANARVERTNAREFHELEGVFPTIGGLAVFRSFTVQDVVESVSQGLLLPGGLTRFVVSPRALRVNYPLESLAAPQPREIKQQALEAWLRARVAGRRVRYYAEATYLFDE